MTNGKAKPRQWTRAHELERLAQLRADAESVGERLWQLYYGLSLEAPAGMAEEWQRKADEAQLLLAVAAKDLETIIGECCGQ